MLEPVSTNSSKNVKYIVFIAIEDSIYRDFFTGSPWLLYFTCLLFLTATRLIHIFESVTSWFPERGVRTFSWSAYTQIQVNPCTPISFNALNKTILIRNLINSFPAQPATKPERNHRDTMTPIYHSFYHSCWYKPAHFLMLPCKHTVDEIVHFLLPSQIQNKHCFLRRSPLSANNPILIC